MFASALLPRTAESMHWDSTMEGNLACWARFTHLPMASRQSQGSSVPDSIIVNVWFKSHQKPYELDRCSTVAELRQQLAADHGVPVSEMKILLGGSLLADDLTIEVCGQTLRGQKLDLWGMWTNFEGAKTWPMRYVDKPWGDKNLTIEVCGQTLKTQKLDQWGMWTK